MIKTYWLPLYQSLFLTLPYFSGCCHTPELKMWYKSNKQLKLNQLWKSVAWECYMGKRKGKSEHTTSLCLIKQNYPVPHIPQKAEDLQFKKGNVHYFCEICACDFSIPYNGNCKVPQRTNIENQIILKSPWASMSSSSNSQNPRTELWMQNIF